MLRTAFAAFLLLASSVGTASAQCSGLTNLVNNTTADATQVMGNFNTLLGCINSLLTFPSTPQGRLTLTSNTPVMVSDTTAATTIYYAPYVGSYLPIYNGTQFVATQFAQLTATTTAGNQQASQVYDLFVFSNSGTPTLGFGPAWSAGTGGSNTIRGTGAGSAALQQLQGLWTNANIMTLLNGSTTYANIPANRATYVGTVAITSTAGQVAMQFKPTAASGGTNTWLGVWNAYNRVSIKSQAQDSTTNWTYGVTTWRPANNSSANRITWVDGLAQSNVEATYQQVCWSASSTGPQIGIDFNSTSATPAGKIGFTQSTATSNGSECAARDRFIALGLNYAQAVEQSVFGTANFNAGGNQQLLALNLEM